MTKQALFSSTISAVWERERVCEWARDRERNIVLSFSSCDLLILYSLNEGESGEKRERAVCVCVCACVKREGGMIGRTVSEWNYAHFSIPAPGGSSFSSHLTWVSHKHQRWSTEQPLISRSELTHWNAKNASRLNYIPDLSGGISTIRNFVTRLTSS